MVTFLPENSQKNIIIREREREKKKLDSNGSVLNFRLLHYRSFKFLVSSYLLTINI